MIHQESPLFNKIKYSVEISKKRITEPNTRPQYHKIFEKILAHTNIQTFLRPPIYCTDYANIIHLPTCDTTSFNKTDVQNHAKFQEWIHEYQEIYRDKLFPIYTDGSKTPNGTGAAYYNERTKSSHKITLTKNWSIYNAELIAIRTALIMLTNTKIHT